MTEMNQSPTDKKQQQQLSESESDTSTTDETATPPPQSPVNYDIIINKHTDRGRSLYTTFKKLGEGSLANVYKTDRIILNHPNRRCALKIFPHQELAGPSFCSELILFKNVSHPNIIKMFDAHVDPKYFYLEMEACAGGDIFTNICKKGKMEEEIVKNIIFKIIDAVRCLHEKDFVHRDLKCENIVFVRKNDMTDIRLIDFGESLHVQSTHIYDEMVGTPCYFAPERFRRPSGDELKKSDVWSIGVIMFEMLTGFRCFYGGDDEQKLQSKIMNKAMKWPANLIISEDAKDFLDNLMKIDPLKRFSCQQALEHKWMNTIQLQQKTKTFYNPRIVYTL